MRGLIDRISDDVYSQTISGLVVAAVIAGTAFLLRHRLGLPHLFRFVKLYWREVTFISLASIINALGEMFAEKPSLIRGAASTIYLLLVFAGGLWFKRKRDRRKLPSASLPIELSPEADASLSTREVEVIRALHKNGDAGVMRTFAGGIDYLVIGQHQMSAFSRQGAEEIVAAVHSLSKRGIVDVEMINQSDRSVQLLSAGVEIAKQHQDRLARDLVARRVQQSERSLLLDLSRPNSHVRLHIPAGKPNSGVVMVGDKILYNEDDPMLRQVSLLAIEAMERKEWIEIDSAHRIILTGAGRFEATKYIASDTAAESSQLPAAS